MLETACTLSEGLSRPPLNYLSNLGEDMPESDPNTGGCSDRNLLKEIATIAEGFIFFWPQSEVGRDNLAFALQGLAHLLFSFYPNP